MGRQIFNIKKGKHYPKGIHLGITFKKYIKFICSFDKSCLYDLGDNDNYDVNKLYGFSTTWFHQIQSGRVGWRCIDGENIQIVTYSYNDGVRSLDDIDVLGEVKPNENFICSITDDEDSYTYTFEKVDDPNSYVIAKDKKQKDWFIFHYLLYPYFGGNRTAPHDMEIYLRRIK